MVIVPDKPVSDLIAIPGVKPAPCPPLDTAVGVLKNFLMRLP